MNDLVCSICNQSSASQPCTNCGFLNMGDNVTLQELYQNQIGIARKLFELEQAQRQAPAPIHTRQRNTVVVVLASLLKPVKFAIEKINLHPYITNLASYLQGSVERDLTSIAEKLTKHPAIRLAAHKKILKGPSFRDLNAPLSYLPIQEVFERQRVLFDTLLQEEKKKIDEELQVIKLRKRSNQ